MLMNFMHFYISRTRNGDHLILLIKAGNAHEEKMLPPHIIDIFKKCPEEGIETQTKMMMAAKWGLLSQ